MKMLSDQEITVSILAYYMQLVSTFSLLGYGKKATDHNLNSFPTLIESQSPNKQFYSVTFIVSIRRGVLKMTFFILLLLDDIG